MGAQIALHCANAGIPALLLDLTADLARQGLEKARKLKPDPQFTPDAYKLVTTGGFDTDLDRIAKTDWIMEAVVERLDIKQQLLARVDEKRRPGSIVSSNTSGIPIATLAEGRSDDFRRHWLGTHFFNPPRYLRLLEIIPTAETDPAVVGGDHALRRSHARQGRGRGEGHAELHRQSHRALRRGAHARGAGHRQVHDRGDRRHHRPRARPPGQRDVPDHGHRRHRRARARDAQPERAPAERSRSRRLRGAAARRAADQARRARREDRQGLLRAAQERRRRDRDLDARSGDARVPPEAVGAHRLDRSRQVDRRSGRARAHAVSRQRQGRRVPARDAGADAGLHRARHARHRPLDRRCRSRDAMGLRLGPRAVRAVRHHWREGGARRGRGRRRPRDAGRRAAAGREPARRRAAPVPRRPRQAGRAGSADSAHGEGTEPRHQEECRREPRRSRRRRDRRRVPFEDERHRRRHHRDAAGRRQGSREERPGAGRSATTRRTSPPAPT